MAEKEGSLLIKSMDSIQLVGQPNVDFDESFETKTTEKKQSLSVRDDPVKILVIGPTGSGKSTLTNALMGTSVAKAEHGAASVTSQVKEYEGEYEGIKIRVYDTTGFSDGGGKSDDSIVREIAKNNKFDLILICIRMDGRVDNKVRRMFIVLGSMITEKMWKRAVIVYTFANYFLELEDINDLDNAAKNRAVKKEKKACRAHVCSYLDSSVNKEIVLNIPICIAGRAKSRRLSPITEDWLLDLWKCCILRSSDEAHTFLSLFASYRRVVEASAASGTALAGGVMGGVAGAMVASVVPVIGTTIGAVMGAGMGAGIGMGVAAIGVAIGRQESNKKNPSPSTNEKTEKR